MCKQRLLSAILVVLLGTPGTGALADGNGFLSVNLASKHVGADRDFNEKNFGLGLGYAVDLSPDRRASIEAGFYKNSMDLTSKYALASYDFKVFEFGNGTDLYLGGFGGLADYGRYAKGITNKGFKAVGNYILFAGAQAAWSLPSGTEFVLGVIPGAPATDMLVTFRIRQRF